METNATLTEISEHEYIRIRKPMTNNKNIRNSISTYLREHAAENSEVIQATKYDRPPFVFDQDSNKRWYLVNDWEEECDKDHKWRRHVELAKKWKAGPKRELPDERFECEQDHEPKKHDQRFEFVTFHQAYSYEDFVEGIRPKSDKDGNVKYGVVPGVFKRICQKAKVDPKQQYAIFIDEINRGNIASIFGELITLLETDKRVTYGKDGSPQSGMILTLPYSGEKFGVPANLDVYGTMNTADRSIALLDTALRRRFQFQEMMPDTSVIEGSSDGRIKDDKGGEIDLRKLLEAINSRIRFLLSRDMTIGHSYLIRVRNFDQLKDVLLSRIIPLLQEYFYDDWHKIQLVFRDVKTGGEKP
ncbi:MAG: AAA domain-containing protein, partial [Candidatus Dadabacteria bacterium]|nr:AAA domain-containing protein [Candidatus Dadabacteria bacterium]